MPVDDRVQTATALSKLLIAPPEAVANEAEEAALKPKPRRTLLLAILTLLYVLCSIPVFIEIAVSFFNHRPLWGILFTILWSLPVQLLYRTLTGENKISPIVMGVFLILAVLCIASLV